jgi:4-amino-4-deoxy-L-arabinose transferase-like glycosyltransferase
VIKKLSEQQKSWLTLLVLWLTLLVLASLRPIAVPDEGRYGEVGRWMLVSGDWLTPRLNGIPFFHKPPFLYWLEAISMGVLGVSALTMRLVPALHAALMLTALYLATRSTTTERIARRAAIMLGSSLCFLVGGQYVNHDMLVATWIGLAIWSFAFSFMAGDKPDANLARLGFVTCALGMLTKGLIGLVLPGLVIFFWLIWTRQFKKIWHLPWLSGLALFALIALPWFVLAQQSYPDFFNYMFIGQQFNRYTATVYNNPQPWWFYLLALGVLLFPWAFFALNQMRRVTTMTLTRDVVMATPWWKLCWSWVLSILLFFSVPNSKLVGYILPVVPPLALLAALGWERVMARRPWAGKGFAALVGVNLSIALAIVLNVGEVTRTARTQDLAQVLACAADPSDTVYVSDAYPYDLPLYTQTVKPMVVLGDWPNLRKQAGDGWQRELFEGADFDAHAAQLLQPMEVLALVAQTPGHWYVGRSGNQITVNLPGWKLYYQGAGWDLHRSGGVDDLTAKSPEAAQHKGLPGCKKQR